MRAAIPPHFVAWVARVSSEGGAPVVGSGGSLLLERECAHPSCREASDLAAANDAAMQSIGSELDGVLAAKRFVARMAAEQREVRSQPPLSSERLCPNPR